MKIIKKFMAIFIFLNMIFVNVSFAEEVLWLDWSVREYPYTEDYMYNKKFSGEFSEGLVPVEKYGNYSSDLGPYLDYYRIGYINKDGKFIIMPKYSLALSFSEGLAIFSPVSSNKYGYIDKNGKEVIKAQYDTVHSFSEGLAFVRKDENKYFYIDKTGKQVIKLEHPQVPIRSSFKEGLAAIDKGNKVSYIDKTGKEKISIENVEGYQFSEGLALIEKDPYSRNSSDDDTSDYENVYIDKNGNEVFSINGYSAYSFSNGMAKIKKNGKYGFIDKKGNIVVNPQYDYVFDFSEDIAVVNKNEKYGFIDKKGNIVIPLEYDYARPFSEGLAPVYKNVPPFDYIYKCGYIDKTGKEIVPLKYTSATRFFEGVAIVSKLSNDRTIYGIIKNPLKKTNKK